MAQDHLSKRALQRQRGKLRAEFRREVAWRACRSYPAIDPRAAYTAARSAVPAPRSGALGSSSPVLRLPSLQAPPRNPVVVAHLARSPRQPISARIRIALDGRPTAPLRRPLPAPPRSLRAPPQPVLLPPQPAQPALGAEAPRDEATRSVASRPVSDIVAVGQRQRAARVRGLRRAALWLLPALALIGLLASDPFRRGRSLPPQPITETVQSLPAPTVPTPPASLPAQPRPADARHAANEPQQAPVQQVPAQQAPAEPSPPQQPAPVARVERPRLVKPGLMTRHQADELARREIAALPAPVFPGVPALPSQSAPVLPPVLAAPHQDRVALLPASPPHPVSVPVIVPPAALPPIPWAEAVPEVFGARLVTAARQLTTIPGGYDPQYMRLAYPMGDVPEGWGVCSDVIVRAYRAMRIDLQELVHLARLGSGDANVDHRRVTVLMRFFAKYGESQKISPYPENYKPGDIVAYDVPWGRTSKWHIAIVSDQLSPSLRPMIIHNRGYGAKLEDALFHKRVIGHYRLDGSGLTALLAQQQVAQQARLQAQTAKSKPGQVTTGTVSAAADPKNPDPKNPDTKAQAKLTQGKLLLRVAAPRS